MDSNRHSHSIAAGARRWSGVLVALLVAAAPVAAAERPFDEIPGFPMDFTAFLEGSDVEGGVSVEDLEQTGRQEIVFGATDGMIHLIGSNGDERRDGLWPRHLPAPIVGRVQVARVDDSGEMRVLAPCLDGRIYCLTRDGDLLWSRAVGAVGWDGSPTVTELVAGGPPRIVVRGPTGLVSSIAGNGFLDWSHRPSSPGKEPVQIVDPQSTGERKVLVPADDGSYALVGRQGQKELEWPKRPAPCNRRPPAIVPVDFDGSGTLHYVSDSPEPVEIAQVDLSPAFVDLSGLNDREFLYVWDDRGRLAARLPRSESRIIGGLAADDLTRSGETQVAWSDVDGKIHLVDRNGNEQDGWPASVERLYNQIADPFLGAFPRPVLARPQFHDVDGDGRPDLVVGLNDRAGKGIRSGMVLALNGAGNLVQGAPFYIGRHRAPPELADLDGDGRMELVVAGGMGRSGPQLHAFRLLSRLQVRMHLLDVNYSLVDPRTEEESW